MLYPKQQHLSKFKLKHRHRHIPLHDIRLRRHRLVPLRPPLPKARGQAVNQSPAVGVAEVRYGLPGGGQAFGGADSAGGRGDDAVEGRAEEVI